MHTFASVPEEASYRFAFCNSEILVKSIKTFSIRSSCEEKNDLQSITIWLAHRTLMRSAGLPTKPPRAPEKPASADLDAKSSGLSGDDTRFFTASNTPKRVSVNVNYRYEYNTDTTKYVRYTLYNIGVKISGGINNFSLWSQYVSRSWRWASHLLLSTNII